MLRNWTLRSRLIALIVALLAITSIVIGTVSLLWLQGNLTDRLDVQLKQAVSVNASRVGPGNGGNITANDGVVAALFSSGASDQSEYRDTDGDLKAVPAASNAILKNVPSDTTPHTMNLGGSLGSYRVIASEISPPGSDVKAKLVVGLPLEEEDKTLAQLAAALVVITLLASIAAALIGAIVVRRALRPLRRVSNVASGVAKMRLETGDVDVSQRVAEHDTNPRTEVGQVGAALNNLLDSVGGALSARQASEAKLRAFVADASHELRTPLASIRGYAELTRRFGGELTADVQHNIDRIESESKRMTALVEDLLLLARLDSQRELDSEEVDLSRLLVDVVSDAHAAGRDHLWDLELPDEPVVVQGDDARLHQVFTNLLANARLHTPAGTRVTVELRQPAGETVTVLVRDTGPGIPQELQPALFGRFVRGDSSRNRNTGSTGLGLSIVAAVVQAHHGSVAVSSEPGETTFRVELPVHAAATPHQAAVAVSA